MKSLDGLNRLVSAKQYYYSNWVINKNLLWFNEFVLDENTNKEKYIDLHKTLIRTELKFSLKKWSLNKNEEKHWQEVTKKNMWSWFWKLWTEKML